MTIPCFSWQMAARLVLNFDLFSLMEPYRSLGEESSHVDGKLSGCLVILGVATIMMLRVWVIIQGPKICSVNRAITAFAPSECVPSCIRYQFNFHPSLVDGMFEIQCYLFFFSELLLLDATHTAAACTWNIEWCSFQIRIVKLSKQRNKKRRLHFFLYFYGLHCCRGIFCQFILHPIKYGTFQNTYLWWQTWYLPTLWID